MNALKNRTFQLTVGLLVIAAVGILSPRVAHAVVATMVQVANTTANPVPNQDVDNLARNFFQSTNSAGGCSGTCVVTFAVVPTGQRLIVRQVSSLVTIGVSGATPPADVELRDFTGSLIYQFLPVVATPANFNNQTQFTAHAAVLASYDSGQIPTVDAFVPSNQPYQVLATISGELITYP